MQNVNTFLIYPLDRQNTKKTKTKMLSFYQQKSYFSQIVYEKSQNINIYFLRKIKKNSNIILGFSFTYLVSVYPTNRTLFFVSKSKKGPVDR